VGEDLGLRTLWLCNGTWNTRDTLSLYWFRTPESKTLRPVLDCIDVVASNLGVTSPRVNALVALYLLMEKVGGPRVHVGYNMETNLRKVTT
jgi:hypothetical protein